MTQHDQVSADVIATQIEQYLILRPHAADSISGIRQWWLGRTARGVSVSKVQQALDILVENDFILCEKRKTGEIVYRVNSIRK